jgi:hypothetical protein
MLECEYSIGKPEIKKEEREAYDEVISDLSYYIDGEILEEIKQLYN